MKLHRALRSDWSDIAPQQRTLWQRWAAGSHGVITPGNLITIIGAALVIGGLYEIAHNRLISGVSMVIVGRLADVLDGLVADYTKTKSPFGEGLDASIDKVLIIIALFVLLDKHLIPLPVGIAMAIHAAYSAGVTTVASQLHVKLHPSRAGKSGALFEWACVGFYLLVDILKQQQHSITIARAAALLCFGLFIVMSIWSGANYARNIYYKKTMRA
jgi:phosphatidylglycerophosphate synthase